MKRGYAVNEEQTAKERGDKMSSQITNYQCPSCTGPLKFSSVSGRLECEYCGSGYDVAEIEAIYAEKEKKAAEAQQESEKIKTGQEELPATEESGIYRV